MNVEQRFPLEQRSYGSSVFNVYKMPFLNLYDTLAETSRRFPNKIGIIDAKGSITFRELQKKPMPFQLIYTKPATSQSRAE